MTSVEDSTLDCPASVIYAAEAGYCFRTKGEQTAQQPPAGCSGVDMFSTISTDGTHDQVCVVGSEDEETREPRIDTGENGKSRVEGISRDGISVTNLDCVLDNVFDDHEHVLGRHLMHAPGVLESVSYRSVKYEHNLAGDDVLARSWGTHESRDNDNQETRSRSKEPTTSSVPRGTARTQNHATSVTSVNDSYSFSRYPSVHASVRTLQETSMSMCLLDQQRAPINEGQNSPDRTPPNSTSISPNHPTLIVRSASPNSGSGAPETRTSSSLLAQEEQDSHQVVYGRLVVLGYTASLVQWHSDPTKGVDTLREGGNDVLELCRRENGNGYAISAPVQYSAFK
ncbi:hypothetical protein HK102_013871 [Quaeritorhiza haematococci]|nr:hypothetical protein HK102_013871 [Quaeritorhiza haematococci]